MYASSSSNSGGSSRVYNERLSTAARERLVSAEVNIKSVG